MRESLIFSEHYAESVNLSDGQQIRLRLVLPSDKRSMQRAFTELSASSRHKRFFAAKASLSEADLRYFTETDGYDHFAIVAVELDESGKEGKGLGIARSIRLPGDVACAEVAITVIDRMQGQGIGHLLLERLVDAALERGIARFRFECLAHNQEMQGLISKVCRIIDTRHDGEVLIAETDLPGSRSTTNLQTQETLFNLYTLLRAWTIQSVDMQMDLGKATMNQTIGATHRNMDLLSALRQSLPFQS
ncbi:MAG: GNAT family N-acetyltransferase [Candidatus Thiodiazotropha sp. (ex Monitilora ramsayi)]|nr:GNAT family N-acetyltransferase [Candidatus Thiodiazotropha sp. (ex Monitilora ramsayi)]